MNRNNLNKARILWQDAISYKTGDKIPQSVSVFETTGLLIEENDDYVIVEKPITTDTKTGKGYPDKQPNFFLIPKVAIIE